MSEVATRITVAMIVPMYNAAPHLVAFRQRLERTRGLAEVILVDDRSTDGTGEILSELSRSDPRVRVILLDENQGAAGARNAGLAAATTSHVWIADVDDDWSPSIVERMAAAALKYRADLVCCQAAVRLPSGKRVSSVASGSFPPPGSFVPVQSMFLSGQIRGYTWDKLFHRRLFEGVAFVSSPAFNDFLGVYRAASGAERIAFVAEELYSHIINHGSVSRSGSTDGRALLSCYEEVAARTPSSDQPALDRFFIWFVARTILHSRSDVGSAITRRVVEQVRGIPIRSVGKPGFTLIFVILVKALRSSYPSIFRLVRRLA